MKLETLTIPAHGPPLAGLRYIPDDHRRSTGIILVHGFTSGKYSMDGLAGYLAFRGYECITFDVVGHKLGGTGGEMNTMAQAAENLADALKWYRKESSVERIVLVGHSMGASAVLLTAAWETGEVVHIIPSSFALSVSEKDAKLAGVICLCMGCEPAKAFDSTIGKAMLSQRMNYVAGSPPGDLLRQLNNIVGSAAYIGEIPALFIAAKQDVLVRADDVQALARSAPAGEMIEIDSSHLEAPDRAKAVIVQWISSVEA